MQFIEAARDFLAYIEMTRSNGTYRYQKSKINVLEIYFDNEDINTIDKKNLVKFISFMRKRNPKITNATLNKYIGIIRRIIRYNIDKDVKFEKLPEDKRIVPTLKQRTINRIFGYYQGNSSRPEMLRNYVLFRLLLDTGLRINEALHLRIRDIDFETSTIHVKVTKTKMERYVFFTKTTKQFLKKLISSKDISDYIFINYQTKGILKVDNIEKVVYRLEKRLKLDEKIKPHKWRHTFATRFIKNGGNLEALRLIMGHTNLKTTQIYLHVDNEHLHKEYFRVNNLALDTA